MVPGKLGEYEVIEQIGAGGMGEVYRARDIRLGREVALKLLPEAFSRDPERLSRFEREARLLAALNHPNIGAIYGLERDGERRFLVLELVPGEDLAIRIAGAPVPLDEVLPIARDIAEALEFAHEQGIVHRDLKPANIKVTPEGRVKVLDFGLAKALESEDGRDPRLSQSPTLLASSPTIAGVILGTAAYMSPEQARGKSVDKRSDVFAFGCVLFEMLTGRQAFQGDTVSDTLASVLKTHADFSALPAETPRSIRDLLKRCLEKDPRLRLRDIGEARIAIDHARHATEEAVATSATPDAPAAPRGRRDLFWGIGTLAVAAVAFFGAKSMSPHAPGDTPLRKFAIEVDQVEASTSPLRIALSPDGTRIAYVVNDRLWVRELSKLDATEIPQTEKAEIPFWSPDGGQVGYRIGATFYRVGAVGGNSTVISNTGMTFTIGSSAVWTESDRIVFTNGSQGLLEVPALGGDPVEVVPKLPTESDLHEPDVLPGGRGYLFVSHHADSGANTLVLYADGARRNLLNLNDQRIATARYSSTGHILYQRLPVNPGIWALPFSLSSLQVTGEPFLVVAGGAEPHPGPGGTLLYREGADVARSQFAWIARDGSLEATISDVFQIAGHAAISPDGTRLAGVVTEASNNGDVWVFDLARGTRQRLTFTPTYDIQPAWSSDGTRVYYVNVADGTIRARHADGTGDEQVVRKGWMPHLTADGKWMLFEDDGPGAQSDIFVVPLPSDSTHAPTPLLTSNANEGQARVSPSGDYLAYASNESGVSEIYLTRFPSGEGKWQVSVKGGSRPRWDSAGGRLCFLSSTSVMEVALSLSPTLRLGDPVELFALEKAQVVIGRSSSYDVARGSQRFAMSYNAAGVQPNARFRMVLVENWLAEYAKSDRK